MASSNELEAHARRLLLAYAMTSITTAGTPRIGGHAQPDSMAPSGMSSHPAESWAVELERLRGSAIGERAELERFVEQLRTELEQVRRRTVPDAMRADSVDDLAALVLDRGRDFEPLEIATALRCTPTFVRRTRLAAGVDPEHGRPVANGDGALDGEALVRLGLSLRAASALSGTPRSTLSDRVRRHGG